MGNSKVCSQVEARAESKECDCASHSLGLDSELSSRLVWSFNGGEPELPYVQLGAYEL